MFDIMFKNPEIFLGMQIIREVQQSDVFSIDNMSEEELREAVIQDILMITMWEKHFQKKLHFSKSSLMRFINDTGVSRVIKALQHTDVVDKIYIQVTEEHVGIKTIKNEEIRIKDDALQEAMDYCGCWYEGYIMPDDDSVIILTDVKETFGATEKMFIDNIFKGMKEEHPELFKTLH